MQISHLCRDASLCAITVDPPVQALLEVEHMALPMLFLTEPGASYVIGKFFPT